MNNNNKGFTLLEMVVAIGLFSVFITIVMSIFSNFIGNQRREIALQGLQEDVYYALEQFHREARTAYGTTFTTKDGKQVFFYNQNRDCVEYAFIEEGPNSSLKRRQKTGVFECSADGLGDTSYAPLTSTDTVINFKNSRFDPSKAEVHRDNPGRLSKQGFITVILEASSGRSTVAPLKLQSTITSQQVIPYGT